MTKRPKKTALLLLSVAALLSAGGGKAFASAAALKADGTVSAALLTAGDIFSGLDADKASYVLGHAPAPGHDMILGTGVLERIATTIGIDWTPRGYTDQIIIRRAATVIEDKDIRDAIDSKLRAGGVDGKFTLVLPSSLPQMILPPDQPQHVEISSLRFDPQKALFEAVLVAPSTDHPLVTATVTGEIRHLVSIPVLKDTTNADTVISSADLDWIDVDSNNIQPGMLLKADSLIGMTPRRMVAAGKPVLDSDVVKPRIVERGDFVTLVYKSGTLLLTIKGKALQNAAQGDLVRVVNISSNRTLQGVATGDHEVTVTE